jgi:DNA (cytosine-5)-methyltransferase 1
MDYMSLFSGIGGFELGFPLHWQCVGFCEIDKYASQIYLNRFSRHIQYGDITRINTAELPDFELLCGGFPCQAFSIAGKRRGFEDTRGTLFFQICRIAEDKRPRLLLLENVKGLLSHDQGQTFHTIIRSLDELGYDLQWQVLNSKNFGVPQSRERVFIVGHLRGTPRPQVFPLAENSAARSAKSKGKESEIATCRSGAKGRPDMTLPFVRVPEATKKGYAEARPGQAINLGYPNSKERRGRVGDIARTLDTGMQQYTLTWGGRVRRLTPVECERLQGFPDGWTEGISDAQRYKCLGNAVTVNVIKAIAEKLGRRSLKEEVERAWIS